MTHTFNTLIVEIDVSNLDVGWKTLRVHCKAVIV